MRTRNAASRIVLRERQTRKPKRFSVSPNVHRYPFFCALIARLCVPLHETTRRLIRNLETGPAFGRTCGEDHGALADGAGVVVPAPGLAHTVRVRRTDRLGQARAHGPDAAYSSRRGDWKVPSGQRGRGGGRRGADAVGRGQQGQQRCEEPPLHHFPGSRSVEEAGQELGFPRVRKLRSGWGCSSPGAECPQARATGRDTGVDERCAEVTVQAAGDGRQRSSSRGRWICSKTPEK
jgi:hypothetical protein